MRIALIVASAALFALLSNPLAKAPTAWAADECTGPECQSGQGGGSHQCEHEKKEQITS
jgi:hypothetical protein